MFSCLTATNQIKGSSMRTLALNQIRHPSLDMLSLTVITGKGVQTRQAHMITPLLFLQHTSSKGN